MSIEQSFFSKLIHTGDFDCVDKKQLRQVYFVGKFKRAYRYIIDFKAKYSKMPSREVFERKNPQIELLEPDEVPESMSYYCDEVRAKYKHNTIADFIEKINNSINDMDADAAEKLARQIVSKLDNEVVVSDAISITNDADRAFKEYEEREACGGIQGIPTGMPSLDAVSGGIGKSELWTVLGGTGVGKTWVLVIIAVHLAREGYDVLLITREMPPSQLKKRIDAVWNKFNYTLFNNGKLSPQEKAKYKEYLEMMQDEDYVLNIEKSVGGISSVLSMCDRYKPDVCLIDGGYLMTDDSEEDDWRAVLSVWRGCKAYAISDSEKNIRFVISAQSTDAEKSSLSKIKFAKAIADESDQVYALEQTEEMYNNHEVRIKPLKRRDGARGKAFNLNWDFDEMDYSPIEPPPDKLKKHAKKLKRNES